MPVLFDATPKTCFSSTPPCSPTVFCPFSARPCWLAATALPPRSVPRDRCPPACPPPPRPAPRPPSPAICPPCPALRPRPRTAFRPGCRPTCASTFLPAPRPALSRARKTSALQFPNAPVTDILDQYQPLTGKHVIPDNKVTGPDQPRRQRARHALGGHQDHRGRPQPQRLLHRARRAATSSRCSASATSRAPRACPSSRTSLQVPDSDADRRLPRPAALPRPAGNRRRAPAVRAAGQHRRLQRHPKAGALIITDTASHLKQLVALISQIDLPPARGGGQIHPARTRRRHQGGRVPQQRLRTQEHGRRPGQPGAAATAAAGVNNGLRRPIRRVGDEGQPVFERSRRPWPPAAASAAEQRFRHPGPHHPDGRRAHQPRPRRHQPVNIPRIEQLLREYDADTPFAQPVRRPLRFVSAKDVLPILVQALSEPGSDNANGSGTSPATGSTNPTNRNSNSTAVSSEQRVQQQQQRQQRLRRQRQRQQQQHRRIRAWTREPVDTTPDGGHRRQHQAHRRPAQQHHHPARRRGGQGQGVRGARPARRARPAGRHPHGDRRAFAGRRHGTGLQLPVAQQPRQPPQPVQRRFASLPTATTGTTTAATGTTHHGHHRSHAATSSAQHVHARWPPGSWRSNFTGVGGIISIGKIVRHHPQRAGIDQPLQDDQPADDLHLQQQEGHHRQRPGNRRADQPGRHDHRHDRTARVGTYTNVDYKDVTLQLEVVPLINSDHEVTLDILQKIDSVVAGSSTVVNGTQRADHRHALSEVHGFRAEQLDHRARRPDHPGREHDQQRHPVPEQNPAARQSFQKPHAQRRPQRTHHPDAPGGGQHRPAAEADCCPRRKTAPTSATTSKPNSCRWRCARRSP